MAGVLIVVNRLGLGKKIDDPLACRFVPVASSRFFPALATLTVSDSAGYPLRRLRKRLATKPKRPKNTGNGVELHFVFFGLPGNGQSGKSAVALSPSRQIIWREYRLDRP